MELTVTSVDYAPAELYGQVPFRIGLLRILPGPDRPDYWLGEPVEPLRCIRNGRDETVGHFMICARWLGTEIALLVQNL